jgi:two-component system, OmpR family, KDP operon response regulator KdpE
LEAMKTLETVNADVILLSGEYREVELAFFSFEVRRRGFTGLVLRITEVLTQPSLAEQDDSRRIEIGDFSIDVPRRRVWIRGVRTQFRPKEFEFLKFLCNHPEELLSRKTLLQTQWGNPEVSSDPLRALIHAVRAKIENTNEPRYIVTVRGLGYRFIPSPPLAS